MSTRTRLGELALQALEQEQLRIQDEIIAIRAELKRMGVRPGASAGGAWFATPVTTSVGIQPSARTPSISLCMRRGYAARA